MNRTRAAAAFPSVIGGPGSDFTNPICDIVPTGRLVAFRFGERFAFRFGSDHVANLSQHLNARRERVPIIVDDPPKFPFQGGGLFVGKFKVHIPRGESPSLSSQPASAAAGEDGNGQKLLPNRPPIATKREFRACQRMAVFLVFLPMRELDSNSRSRSRRSGSRADWML